MYRLIDRLPHRRATLVLADGLLVFAAYYCALLLRFDGTVPPDLGIFGSFQAFLPIAITVHLGANWGEGVYRIVTRFLGVGQALRMAKSGLFAMTFLLMVVLALPGSRIAPISVVLIGALLSVVAMAGYRLYWRVLVEHTDAPGGETRNLLVVGAGAAASAVVSEVHRNPSIGAKIVALVDDNRRLKGMRLRDVPVMGTVDDVPSLVERHGIDEILIAIPSAEAADMARIHEICSRTSAKLKTLPSLGDLVNGEASLADARELRIEDLLGRPKAEIDVEAIAEFIRGRRVLITGAAGSIGSELSRQISAFHPAQLVLVDKDESALYQLHEDLRKLGDSSYSVHPMSVSVRHKVEWLFARVRPEVVFHAAAYKHVPLMEMNPDEAVITNVKGTAILAETAAAYGVERFINISTDKAVDPVNVMGATKRIGEMIVRRMSLHHPGTRFASVRFGNVLGSRGSVIPIFRRQIEGGGPVTITHPEMTRYFMTIEEAVRLVLQAATLAETLPHRDRNSTGVFVLEMGEPVTILSLAEQMIGLLGKGRDIAIEFTGLRPGEKLEEHLVCCGEAFAHTEHPLINVATLDDGLRPNPSDLPGNFDGNLRELIHLAEINADSDKIRAAMMRCAPTYHAQNGNGNGRAELREFPVPGTGGVVHQLEAADQRRRDAGIDDVGQIERSDPRFNSSSYPAATH